jgi:YfiH family protein
MQSINSRLLDAQSLIDYCFTTRHNGCSLAPFQSNNLAFHVGDKTTFVMQNHHALANAVGYEIERLIHMRQIHSDRVVYVDSSFHFDTPPECDALICDTPGIALMVMVADCTPILLVDPVKKAVAAIHAGRAGAFKNIITKTLDAMQHRFGSNPRSLYAVMGPSICQSCYEINSEIAAEAETLGYGDAVNEERGCYYLNVRLILKKQLLEAGVISENIEQQPHCSSCENETFFSYRADGGTTGRMAGVIMLRNP